jgi:hypothetical protein
MQAVKTSWELICLASFFQGNLMCMSPELPGLLASSGQLLPGLSLVLLASHRSKIPGQPMVSSSPDEDLGQESRAIWWPLWKSVGDAGLHTRPYVRHPRRAEGCFPGSRVGGFNKEFLG